MLFNYKSENNNKTPVLLPLFGSIPAEKAGKSSNFIIINLGDLRCGNFSCNGTRISCLSSDVGLGNIVYTFSCRTADKWTFRASLLTECNSRRIGFFRRAWV